MKWIRTVLRQRARAESQERKMKYIPTIAIPNIAVLFFSLIWFHFCKKKKRYIGSWETFKFMCNQTSVLVKREKNEVERKNWILSFTMKFQEISEYYWLDTWWILLFRRSHLSTNCGDSSIRNDSGYFNEFILLFRQRLFICSLSECK